MFHVKLITALVIGAAVWPAGAYATQDLLSPDARDAVQAAEQGQSVETYSTDARDAVRVAEQAQSVDLLSPDARDAVRAAEQGQSVATYSTDARDAGRAAPQIPASSGNSSGNLDWRYLVIGGLGSILIVGVAISSTRRRRRRLARPPVTVRG